MSTEIKNQAADVTATIERPPHAGDAYELVGVGRTYVTDAQRIEAVKPVDLTIARGEFVVIEGPSGSGKSTFLQLLGMLDQPTSGRITCAGDDVSNLSAAELAELRLRTIGFIFQQFNLIPTLTARQNIEIAMFPAGIGRDAARARALELLDQVGLAERADHFPGQLSGGEQQRVAIARALANRPQILLADEPTGNLDSATSEEILELIRGLWSEGLTVVLITHDKEITKYSTSAYTMRDGQLTKA